MRVSVLDVVATERNVEIIMLVLAHKGRIEKLKIL
jgi:hypothetical protein